jgi:hypothetical protein
MFPTCAKARRNTQWKELATVARMGAVTPTFEEPFKVFFSKFELPSRNYLFEKRQNYLLGEWRSFRNELTFW